ncbi:related to neutral amino acid permease [Fusarium fujikuroi IMI 58289]|uniref:Related to neutral amino acid permease n=1 Tax=Gibberella fujikuroi (strain CBS 195.34 / IMI 58289 / NRRL A-6831) TaxID=1279085 RepID=S0ELE8_GIBF5|nr:related to neutral amino acid permease [Fusarium fujikuroi IMI 58289]KLO81841.1 neutral amino acid permease [Fusarium fujikuroi]KLP05702.1 neutral amino acid permease [Fusarium fujikuroi]KLP23445.1 neutral amino acid permease [Fusarium fujikuroi]CCT75447.1 related to neutral amino acid permease [Fusarium fujikuroi IMI 58289]SCO16041.1 related to neutral amino acid permease [Fusarium fujikuroi]
MSHYDSENQAPEPTKHHGEEAGVTNDAVFGTITEDGPNYRNVGWLGTSVLMMKSQIGLGVLSIPASFDALGLIPGIICMLCIAVITTWSDYIVGRFKQRHPEVYGIDDAAGLVFGRFGREFYGISYSLLTICIAGSAMLGISIALNSLSMHGTCTAVFVAVACVVAFVTASIRTLDKVSWLAWVGLVTLVTSIFVVTIAVGVQDRPDLAPKDGVWKSDYKLFNTPTFAEAMSAIAAFIFAYCGTPVFFPIAAEMREPKHYKKALILCQSVVTVVYIVVGIVVYYYCGTYVASPALGSAGKTIKKVSYGLALPGLIVSATLYTHVPAKYAFVRLLRGSKHLTANSFTHWAVWLSCTFGMAIIAYVIASGIPVFGGLVSLVGALLGTLQCMQLFGCLWLYDHWAEGKDKSQRTTKWTMMVGWCIFVIVLGTFLMIGGTYGSIKGIIDSYNVSGGSAAWSCADNSNSS